MTAFPRSPKTAKGAIVGFDLYNPLASVVVFQYNPETMRRSVQGRFAGGGEGNRAEQNRLEGPPRETISLSVEIDATDQLEAGDGWTADTGVASQLAALEMLLYPKAALHLTNAILMAAGTREIIQPEAPFTLFVWGPKRVLPVRVTGFSIDEEAFDPNLNPIQAKASLELQVLSYADLPPLHVGSALFLAHQIVKEVMATVGSVGNVASVVSGDVRLV